MRIFEGNEYATLYRDSLVACREEGESGCSRVGNVYDLGPVCFEISGSEAGFPFLSGRGLNPYFALAELAWFYKGSNELLPLRYFINNYDNYSDDGITLYGAYGYRVNKKFGVNQIDSVVNELKKRPDSRRAVVSLYSADDLNNLESLDIPCNLSVLFKIRKKSLDITIFNRSNDVFKGVPYNFFLFRFFQYLVAKNLNLKVGFHRHVTDSLHLYESDFAKVDDILSKGESNKNENVCLEMSLFTELTNCSEQIHSRDFQAIDNPRLRAFFMGYVAFKAGDRDGFFRSIDGSDRISTYVKDWLDSHHAKF